MKLFSASEAGVEAGLCPCCRRPGSRDECRVAFSGAFRTRAASLVYVCRECLVHVSVTLDPARAIHARCPITGHYTS